MDTIILSFQIRVPFIGLKGRILVNLYWKTFRQKVLINSTDKCFEQQEYENFRTENKKFDKTDDAVFKKSSHCPWDLPLAFRPRVCSLPPSRPPPTWPPPTRPPPICPLSRRPWTTSAPPWIISVRVLTTLA